MGAKIKYDDKKHSDRRKKQNEAYCPIKNSIIYLRKKTGVTIDEIKDIETDEERLIYLKKLNYKMKKEKQINDNL